MWSKPHIEKSLKKTDIETFKKACESSFKNKLDEEGFWCVLEDMYFQNGGVI